MPTSLEPIMGWNGSTPPAELFAGEGISGRRGATVEARSLGVSPLCATGSRSGSPPPISSPGTGGGGAGGGVRIMGGAPPGIGPPPDPPLWSWISGAIEGSTILRCAIIGVHLLRYWLAGSGVGGAESGPRCRLAVRVLRDQRVGGHHSAGPSHSCSGSCGCPARDYPAPG